jgi:hypothetical protein
MHLLVLFIIIVCNLGQGTSFDVSDCPAGYFCTARGITPIPCPAGTWSNAGAAQCTPCEEGYYSTKAGSSYCIICEQGHFCTLANLPPQPCPLGTYNEKLGQTQCTSCKAGTYTSQPASVECTSCPAGSSCSDAAALPEECSPGTDIFLFSGNHFILFLQVISVLLVKYHAVYVLKVFTRLQMVLNNVMHVLLDITV